MSAIVRGGATNCTRWATASGVPPISNNPAQRMPSTPLLSSLASYTPNPPAQERRFITKDYCATLRSPSNHCEVTIPLSSGWAISPPIALRLPLHCEEPKSWTGPENSLCQTPGGAMSCSKLICAAPSQPGAFPRRQGDPARQLACLAATILPVPWWALLRRHAPDQAAGNRRHHRLLETKRLLTERFPAQRANGSLRPTGRKQPLSSG